MPNHLASETSPYLLQHAGNPVDWYPWGDDAFTRARAEDKPLLVSIGYAACHWCHVMERESFEDAETARLMNEHFVCIKVDREERPDVDAVYMDAVVTLTGVVDFRRSIGQAKAVTTYRNGQPTETRTVFFTPTDIWFGDVPGLLRFI